VASALFEALIPASEAEGFWTLQAGMFPENEASIKVHEKAGFRAIGRREKNWPDEWCLARYSPFRAPQSQVLRPLFQVLRQNVHPVR